MIERKPLHAPEPAQKSEPMESREPVDMVMQDELREQHCDAKCPRCDEGFS